MSLLDLERAPLRRRPIARRPLSDDDDDGPWLPSGRQLEFLGDAARVGAHDNFAAFRRYIRPDMLWDWWPQLVADELQRFYEDFIAGKRPKLALMSPPQHGKSWTAEDFIAWTAGKNPDLKTIFASYSDDLGVRTNNALQRRFDSDGYRRLFPATRTREAGWMCNTSLIEFAQRSGSFRNTTVDGPINGMELHLGVIDDPHKGRAEALSKTARDRVWNWFADDWGARFSKNSAMLIVMTRWHVDDLLGRFIAREPGLRQVSFPAIAVRDEAHRKQGEPLFENLKPLPFLQERKRIMSTGSWESEYQQNPIIVGGGMLPIEKLQTRRTWGQNDFGGVRASCRYWDKSSGASDDSAFTAGVLMHVMHDGSYVISHVTRGRWLTRDRENRIRMWAEADEKLFVNYQVGVEQEPGSGGKDSVEATIRNLAGFRAFADKPTGSKVVRAEPFTAQVQNGNVFLIAGDWVMDFLDEAEAFPNGPYKDQIDAASGAFNHLAKTTTFDSSFSWA